MKGRKIEEEQILERARRFNKNAKYTDVPVLDKFLASFTGPPPPTPRKVGTLEILLTGSCFDDLITLLLALRRHLENPDSLDVIKV